MRVLLACVPLRAATKQACLHSGSMLQHRLAACRKHKHEKQMKVVRKKALRTQRACSHNLSALCAVAGEKRMAATRASPYVTCLAAVTGARQCGARAFCQSMLSVLKSRKTGGGKSDRHISARRERVGSIRCRLWHFCRRVTRLRSLAWHSSWRRVSVASSRPLYLLYLLEHITMSLF